MARVEHLGWDQQPVDLAADWIVREYTDQLPDSWIALPGARSGRILTERLARRQSGPTRPARILTAGNLTDVLLEIERPMASRLARTLAWERALRDLSPKELSSILARVPDVDGPTAAWVRLAEKVRSLFGELAAEGLVFGDVADCERLSVLDGERSRWQALAKAQVAMLAHIRRAGLDDPHVARREAIEAGRLRENARVLLVGVVELNGLSKRLLALPGIETTALVFAPEDRADDFDDYGCLIPERVVARGLTSPMDCWTVVEDPEAQAQAAIDEIAKWNSEFAAEQITIGVANAEVTPYLKRRLHSLGVLARDAAGRSFSGSRPARLCAALATHLRDASFHSFSELVRHPDVGALLGFDDDQDPIGWLDKYQARHLPDRVDGKWVGESRERDRMTILHARIEEVMGLGQLTGVRALRQWAAVLREILLRVYAGPQYESDKSADDDGRRELTLACEALAEAIDELSALPELLEPELAFADAIDLALRSLSGRSLPPAGERKGEATIELLGWLELALDDAPALIVTGYEDGLVPETLGSDAFLPDSLRHSLGLADNRGRLARDLYLTDCLLQSRSKVHFITGRKSRSLDPQLPSRILFHGDAELVPQRVRQFIHAPQRSRPEHKDDIRPSRRLPMREGVAQGLPERFSATSFRTYIDSPYLFYLRHVLRVETLHDRHHEMDPLAFGILAHDALEAYGKSEEMQGCADEDQIRAYLQQSLERLAFRKLGKSSLPAAKLQVDQLAWRLDHFATDQAKRVADGWRIAHVEWSPKDGAVALDVDGRTEWISGRIDRIDYHQDGRWAIWDYKTSEKVKDPGKLHRNKKGVWLDLQLPLYRRLAAELGRAGLPELGWISISGERKSQSFHAVNNWAEADFESAEDEARAIIRKVRDGCFDDLGKWKPNEPVMQAIGGLGLVSALPAGEQGGEE